MADDELHPADQILLLDTDDSPTERGASYNSGYQPFDVPAPGTPVPQAQPGKAVPTFANKVQMLNNPGVKVPDRKTVPLVAVKMTDGPNVERVDDARTRRQLYEVTIAAKMRRGGAGGIPEEFDTETIKKKVPEQEIGANALGRDADDDPRFKDLSDEWNKKSLIWVCAIEQGRLGVTFYSHVGRIHKFHHSSFTAGGSLVAAGEWIVEHGELRRISGNSGHYRPTIAELHRAVLCMSPAWQADTEVMVFNKQANNWEYVPVNMFKTDPSGGGKYTAHAAQA